MTFKFIYVPTAVSAAVSRSSLGIHILSTPRGRSVPSCSAMKMSAPIPRFLLPQGYMRPYAQLPKLVRLSQTAHRTPPICRNASASTSKPRVLEKPTRFNPPSHGKRLKKQVPRQYGPQLTGEQKTEQETKRYPRMMPPEGTFMHWFLTSHGIHTFIALVRGQLNHCIHGRKMRFFPQDAMLNHPTRAPSSSSPPSQPSKDGALPTRSANISLNLATS